MKKNLIAALGLAATVMPFVAHAQSNVTVYGLLDVAVETYNNANATGASMVRLPALGGGMFPSRLGFRGDEDLGDGLKAVFVLESGFAPVTGALGQGNRMFGRQANVGLSGGWGTVTAGRNYNMLTTSTFDVDTFGPSQYGIGSLDSFIPNGRSDNSIAYKGKFSNVMVGATYSLGRDSSSAGGPGGTNCAGESATDAMQCREWSGMVRYDGQGFVLVSAYDRIYGGPGAAAGLTSSSKTDSRLHLGALFRVDYLKVGVGAISRNNEGSATPHSTMYYIGAAYDLTPQWIIDGQLAKLDYRDSSNKADQALIRAIYNLSKRSSVYVAAGRINNDGASAVALSAGGSVGAGMGQTGVIAGLKHSF